MAASGPEKGFDAAAEMFQHVSGNKGLYGACKSSAMNTEAASFSEKILAYRKRYGYILFFRGRGYIDILKIFK